MPTYQRKRESKRESETGTGRDMDDEEVPTGEQEIPRASEEQPSQGEGAEARSGPLPNTDQLLGEMQQRYRALATATGQIIWVADAAGRLTGDMTAWCAFTGQSAAQAAGWGWLEAVHPEDREEARGVWSRALADGSLLYENSYRLCRHDNEYRAMAVRAAPVMAADGRIREWVGTCADITERLALEQMLAGRVSELETIFATLPDRLSIFDAEGTIVRLNPAAQANAGAQRGDEHLEELPEAYGLRTVEGEPFPAAELPLARALRGERVADLELRYRGPDGADQSILTNTAPLFDPQGRVTGAVSIVHDISALRQAEREATARAKQFEATLGAMADAVLVFDGETRGIYANEAYWRLLALERRPGLLWQTLDARRGMLVLRDEQGEPFPADQQATARVLRGERLAGATALDMRCRALDGRELRVSVSGAPITDAQGRVTGGVIVIRDVTERRALEQRTHTALQGLLAMAEMLVHPGGEADTREAEMAPGGEAPAEGTFEAAAEAAPDRVRTLGAPLRGLARVTRDILGCRRVSVTSIESGTGRQQPLAVVGLSAEQERQWWADQATAAPLDASPFPELVARLRAGETVLCDMTQPPFDQGPNPYGLRVLLLAPMRLGDELVGLLAVDHGGEEHEYSAEEQALASAVAKLGAMLIERERLLRERAEARSNELALLVANQRMDEFIGVAAHELRTPITSALINVQLAHRQLQRSRAALGQADETVTGLDRLRGLLERSEFQMKRQNRLVSDLIEVSRIQARRLELRREPLDLGELVRESVTEQRLGHPERTIALELPAGAVMVRGDADRLSQVVTNYLSNALKFAPERSRVAVRVVVFARSVRVSVRDRGPGLPAGEQERVWERFHRTEWIVVQDGSAVGLGLGLYISRNIVQGHGGRVGVRSAPGRGATFWFSLPLAGEDGAGQGESEDEAGAAG